mgnify:CR=1 FL=1
MNKIIAAENPIDVAELLSPANQPMADVEILDIPEKTNAFLGFLGQLTHDSYDAWLARGGMQNSVE